MSECWELAAFTGCSNFKDNLHRSICHSHVPLVPLLVLSRLLEAGVSQQASVSRLQLKFWHVLR